MDQDKYRDPIYTIIFVTRGAAKVIDGAIAIDLKSLFGEVCLSWGCRLIDFSCDEDHAKLLVKIGEKVSLSRLIGALSQISSRYSLMKAERGKPGVWSDEFISFVSCSEKDEMDLLSRAKLLAKIQ